MVRVLIPAPSIDLRQHLDVSWVSAKVQGSDPFRDPTFGASVFCNNDVEEHRVLSNVNYGIS
jgi:hypothetical protein